MKSFMAVALVGLMTRSANAQVLADTVLHPGSRVRVQSIALGAAPREGSFISIANDTLAVNLKGEPAVTRIAIDQVSALEVSIGRTPNMIRDADRGSHYGGLTGAVIGGIAGAASSSGATGGNNTVRVIVTGIGALGGYFIGRMYGTVAGGVAGAVDQDDVWKPVMLPARR